MCVHIDEEKTKRDGISFVSFFVIFVLILIVWGFSLFQQYINNYNEQKIKGFDDLKRQNEVILKEVEIIKDNLGIE